MTLVSVDCNLGKKLLIIEALKSYHTEKKNYKTRIIGSLHKFENLKLINYFETHHIRIKTAEVAERTLEGLKPTKLRLRFQLS